MRTQLSSSLVQNCVYIHVPPSCTYIAIWCATMHVNKRMTTYYTPNDGFTGNNAPF